MKDLEHQPLTYWLDEQDRIQLVSPSWDEVAENYRLDSAKSSSVLGKPLRQFIKDSPTQMLLEAMIDLVRLTKSPLRRQYRCDTSKEMRLMEMVLKLDGDWIEVQHQLIKSVPRQTAVHYALEKTSQMMQHCSMCERLRFEEKWVEADEIQQAHPSLLENVFLIHTICENCANIDNLRRGHFVGDFSALNRE